jgi:hypothetical protein
MVLLGRKGTVMNRFLASGFRMDEDMIVRGMADRTRESYLWAVTGLARFYRREPDRCLMRRSTRTCCT